MSELEELAVALLPAVPFALRADEMVAGLMTLEVMRDGATAQDIVSEYEKDWEAGKSDERTARQDFCRLVRRERDVDDVGSMVDQTC